MEKLEKNRERQIFGLVGKNISYSFSRKYFSQKFSDLELDVCEYLNFDLKEIDQFPKLIHELKFDLKGLNVTIPYKEKVLKFLHEIDEDAEKIGAINTIKVTKKGKLKGYNTDVLGFIKSIQPLLLEHHKKALILGTGGASKAIAFGLKQMGIDYVKVSRDPKKHQLSYKDVTEKVLESHTIIINCSPLGTYPKIEEKPKIDYSLLNKNHLCYDLIYNPSETAFLRLAKENGAVIKNGYEMLEIQAEEAWRIWNEKK